MGYHGMVWGAMRWYGVPWGGMGCHVIANATLGQRDARILPLSGIILLQFFIVALSLQ